MSTAPADRAVCLGCGCLCDDVAVSFGADGTMKPVGACSIGNRWFRNGIFPSEIRIGQRNATFDEAIASTASVLMDEPGRLLIYVAGDVTCEAQREAVALADRLGASIDGITSDTVSEGLLAAQRRGRATGTLGELRHRADVVLFWNVDPDQRTPRFIERFVAAPALLTMSRRLVSVDVGTNLGPKACSERFRLEPSEEVDGLRVMRAAVLGRPLGELTPAFAALADFARRLAAEAKYVAIVFGAEPRGDEEDDGRTEGLITLAQVLNGPTRAAAWGLRDGGNRNGFESVLTWQTGYPFSVDFRAGFPSYAADETAAERLAAGRYRAVLVLGNPETIPPSVAKRLADVEVVAVGSCASAASFVTQVAIDTGAASLHEGGLVLRMDDVPIQARAVLSHKRLMTQVLRSLAAGVSTRLPTEVG